MCDDMDLADNVIRLYRLLVASKRPIGFEEARDRLGLSDDEMRRVAHVLSEALESDDRDVAAV